MNLPRRVGDRLVRVVRVAVIAALLSGIAGARSESRTQLLDEASYNQTLQRRHFDLTQDQLIALGDQEYQRIDAQMAMLARQIDPSKSWRQILELFERDSHPRTLGDVVPAYERELRHAMAFVTAQQLVSLPSSLPLPVVPTPNNLLGAIPYALYFFGDDVLYVTLAGGHGDESEALLTHNDGFIAVAAVHEGYPGHRTHKLNLIKPIKETNEDTETLIEGWGLYAEELMLRAGYYDSKPLEQKLFGLRMLLHRAARAFLDPKIHRGDITLEQAIRFLTDEVGLSETRARGEVRRYINAPGSAATYLVGKRQIEQLRRQVRADQREGFTLQRFHGRLLSAGGLPIQMIARQVFRVELDPAGVFQLDAESPPATAESPATSSRVRWRLIVVVLIVLTVLVFVGPLGRRGAIRAPRDPDS